MIDSTVNKSVEVSTEPEPVDQPKGFGQDYHFSGHGEFYAASINAPNIQAATKVWIQKRVRIHP
jgi:hypothetical protein